MNINKKSYLNDYLPFFKDLSEEEQILIDRASHIEEYELGQIIYSKQKACSGIILVIKGQLRSFMSSLSGKEITLFRLFQNDLCILSSSCVYQNLTYDINLQAEENTVLLVIDGILFKQVLDKNINVQKFMLEITQSKLSEIMWVLEQVVFFSLEYRLADYILNQYYTKNALQIYITHEMIAKDLGSSREVISRMLKRFEKDQLVHMGRGYIKIIDIKGLKLLCK